MKKLRTAIIGSGFMGKVHAEAIRRLGNVELAAIAVGPGVDAVAVGKSFGVDRVSSNWQEVVNDSSIDAVHVLTPNALHAPMSIAAMKAGRAVLCEKPVATTSAEAAEMVKVAEETGIANAVNHNLRYYPVLQQIRQMIAAGELGEVLVVQGTYSQDWLLYDTDYNWRIEAADNGRSRVVGDIGSHWMDMIQHLTGQRITEVCADTAIFHKTRKKPKGAVETFTGKMLKPEDYQEIPITTEDFASVLVRLGDRARGAYTVSQMSAGCKNRFQIEIFGTKCGVMWNQESPDQLWIGHRNSPNQLMVKDPSLMYPAAAAFADLPGGHSEGYDDAHKQLYRRFYRRVADPAAPIDYPTFADGAWGMKCIEAVMDSGEKRAWVKVG